MQSVLAGMPEGRMPKIMNQRHAFGQILVEPQARASARAIWATLDRMGEPRAVMIAIGGDEDLRLVFQATEGSGVDDPVAVALEVGAGRAGTLCVKAAAGRPGLEEKTARSPKPKPRAFVSRPIAAAFPLTAVSEPSYL